MFTCSRPTARKSLICFHCARWWRKQWTETDALKINIDFFLVCAFSSLDKLQVVYQIRKRTNAHSKSEKKSLKWTSEAKSQKAAIKSSETRDKSHKKVINYFHKKAITTPQRDTHKANTQSRSESALRRSVTQDITESCNVHSEISKMDGNCSP